MIRNLSKFFTCIAFIITLVMSVGFISFAFVPADIEGTPYKEAIETLVLLGIFNNDEDDTFKPEEVITRREFALIVCRILGMEKEIKMNVQTPFTDVTVDDPASGSIKIVSEMGIIKGYGDGRFGPDDTISYEQAVKAMVCMLGYEFQAINMGGYPAGYLLVAREKGLTGNVDGTIG